MAHLEQNNILYSPNLVQAERKGLFLLIDPSAPNWASVNSSGSAIIRRCDGHRTMREVCAFADNELRLKAEDVTYFVKQAAEAGLISTAPDLAPAYRGRARAIAPESLEELWIHTNNSCSLRCKHCLVDGGAESVKPLTTTEIKKLVDDALDLGATRIYFTGGEPFLRKDLLSLVEYVTERAHMVILTSGVLMSGELAERLKAKSHGNLLIQVSLEGPDAETNDAIRGERNFELAVLGIKNLVKAGLTPIVTTTLTRLNYMKAPDTTRFLASLGVKDHHVLWLHGRGRMRQNIDELLLPGETVARVMKKLRQAAKQTGIIVDNHESLSVRVRGKRSHKNDLCNSCYSLLSVNTDGHVYPCAALNGAQGFDCGSIKEKSLRRIWLESPVAGWIRENSLQKRVGCNSCFLKFFCGGGCFAQSYFNYEITQGYGCIMAPDPYCAAYKSQLMELMWEAATPEPVEKINSRPALYRHMGNEVPECASGSNKVLDAAFDVGTYHCSCVLAVEVKE